MPTTSKETAVLPKTDKKDQAACACKADKLSLAPRGGIEIEDITVRIADDSMILKPSPGKSLLMTMDDIKEKRTEKTKAVPISTEFLSQKPAHRIPDTSIMPLFSDL